MSDILLGMRGEQISHDFAKIASRRFLWGRGYRVICKCGWQSSWNLDPKASLANHRRRMREKSGA